MSSVWMSGGISMARAERERGAQPGEEELETFTIYLRVPQPGENAGSEIAGDAEDHGTNAADASTVDNAPNPDDSKEPRGVSSTMADALPLTAEPRAKLDQVAVNPLIESETDRAPQVTVESQRAQLSSDARVKSVPPPSNPIAPLPLLGAPPLDALASQTAAPSPSSSAGEPKASAPNEPIPAGSSVGTGSGAGASAASGSSGKDTGRGGNHEGQGSAGSLEPGAVLTYGPRPEYPALSVRHGEEGQVLCSIHIDARGSVTRVDVLQSSGHPRLDQAAMDALANWRFLPAHKDGRAVACRVPHCVTFRLE